jgi:hypothetical protein
MIPAAPLRDALLTDHEQTIKNLPAVPRKGPEVGIIRIQYDLYSSVRIEPIVVWVPSA